MTTPPSWLAQLADAAAGCLTTDDSIAPMGCHFYYHEPSRTWEVALFVTSTETLGGMADGQETWSRFMLDVEAVRKLFDEIDEVTWQSLPAALDDEFGCHIRFSGRHAQRKVSLAVLAMAPDRFESGVKVSEADAARPRENAGDSWFRS